MLVENVKSYMKFENCPLPPSSNNQYLSFVRGGRVIHVPSLELKRFRKNMESYWYTQDIALKFAREAFSGKCLMVDVEFRFEKSRLLSKKGTLKKLDVSNRLKALHDALADALFIDDSAFIDISASKVAVEEKSDECAVITIRVADFVIIGKKAV